MGAKQRRGRNAMRCFLFISPLFFPASTNSSHSPPLLCGGGEGRGGAGRENKNREQWELTFFARFKQATMASGAMPSLKP